MPRLYILPTVHLVFCFPNALGDDLSFEYFADAPRILPTLGGWVGGHVLFMEERAGVPYSLTCVRSQVSLLVIFRVFEKGLVRWLVP